MSDDHLSDYLWDRSGEPDPDVVELEETLHALRFDAPPMVVFERTPVTPTEPTQRRRGSVWTSVATAAAATLAAALLAWWWGFLVGQRDPGSHAERQRAPAVAMQGPSVPDPDPQPGPAKGYEHETELEPELEAEPEPEHEEPEPEDEHDGSEAPPDSVGKKMRKTSRRAKRTKRTKPTKSSSSSSSSPNSKSSKSSKPTTTEVSVDCILDPSRPECRGSGSSSSSKSSGSAGDPDPSLPEKLTTSDIKQGIAPTKAAAKACGPRHGAAPGDKVKVKLTISGATGTVTSASAQPPHNGTPLGNCVASALEKAEFPRFRKPSLGVVYPIRL